MSTLSRDIDTTHYSGGWAWWMQTLGYGSEMAEGPASVFRRTLMENAELFLRESIRYVGYDRPKDWAFALVTLSTALELTLKAILKDEHWSLVFEEANAASLEKLKAGQIRSVRFREALRRCEDVVGLRMAEEDRRYLLRVNKFRNQILHYEFTLNVEQVKSLVAKGIAVFIRMYSEGIDSTGELPVDISGELVTFEQYVRLRMADLKPQLEQYDRPRGGLEECPNCFQCALVVRDERLCCLYCGEGCEVEDLLAQGEMDGGPCPECTTGRFSLIPFNNEEFLWQCVICGFEVESNKNTECTHCGQSFWDRTDLGVCPPCLETQLEKE